MSDLWATALPLLLRHPLFQVLPLDHLEGMVRRAELRHAALGEGIVRRGDSGEHLYLVLRGRVRFSRGQPDGTRATLAIGSPGDLIGDEALVPPGNYAVTCSAADPSELLRLPVADLLDLICQSPVVDYHLQGLIGLHRLIRRLRDDTFNGFQQPPEFQRLLAVGQSVRVPPGTRMTRAGEVGDQWYFLRNGIGISREPGGSVRGLGPDHCVGTEALLGQPSPADVRAVSAVSAFCLARTDFEQQATVAAASGMLVSQGVAFTWVGQRQALDCGAAALTMAARRLGRRVAIEDVATHLRLGERGAPLAALHAAATALGLHARAIQASADTLATVDLPAIALVSGEHYCILYELAGSNLLVGDPTRGVLTVPREEFLRQWSGHLLSLRTGDLPGD